MKEKSKLIQDTLKEYIIKYIKEHDKPDSIDISCVASKHFNLTIDYPLEALSELVNDGVIARNSPNPNHYYYIVS